MVVLGVLLAIVFANTSLAIDGQAVVLFCAQLVLAYGILRVGRTLLSVSSLFSLVWVVYFPLRMLVITLGGPSPYYFPAVNAATPAQLLWAWNATTLGFLTFFVGVSLTVRNFRPRRLLDERQLTYNHYQLVSVVGALILAVLYFAHASSGILGNVGEILLFGIAGASYLEVEAREGRGASGRARYLILLLVAIGVALGYASGFKQLALMPIAAWIIGRAAARGRVGLRYVVIAFLAAGLAFAVIQGERDSTASGHPASGPISALGVGLTEMNLAYGTPEHFSGLGVVGNVVNGILYRMKGADYLLAISQKVPRIVPFQGGLSIVEPALSILPGYDHLASVRPQYAQLSLGRYVDQEFVSEQPTTDPSSQSMTYPGDLYLNFGTMGIVVGMLVFGVVFAGFDQFFQVRGPVSAAVLAFAGIALLGLDGNIAYVVVTSAVRLGVCAAMLGLVLRRRPGARAPATP